MNSINNLLSSNQFAAKTLWNVSLNNGNSASSASGSSASGLLGIIKNNLAQKANSKNSAQISALEGKVSDLTNKLGKFDGYKSKLAQLATAAEGLTDLRSKIKINQTNSELTTSSVSVSGSGLDLKNVNGKLQNGVYGLKVSYANGSGPSSLISNAGAIDNENLGTITRSNILNSKISQFKGYKKTGNGTETITLTNGTKSANITVNENTTVQDFLDSVNNSNIGVVASYDSNNGRIKFETDGAASNLHFVSDGVENANTLSVLKLNSISDVEEQSKSTINIGRKTTFGDVGYSGSINNGNSLFERRLNISDNAKYGDTLVGNTVYKNSITGNMDVTFYEDKMVVSSTKIDAVADNNFANQYEFKQNYSFGRTNRSDILNHYDMEHASITATIDISKLSNITTNKIEYNGQTYDKTNVTYAEALISLGVITQEDIDNSTDGYIAVDMTGAKIKYMDSVFSSFNLEVQAKTGTNAPTSLYDSSTADGADKLVDLVSNKKSVTTGTFTISDSDGNNQQTFTITKNTTFAELQNFLTSNGVTMNEEGSLEANNKTFGGSSNLKNLFATEITSSSINFESILPTETSSIEKNISGLGLSSDSSFSINGNSIDLNTDDSLDDLITRINQSQSDVVASFDQTTKQITLTSVDPLKKIDIIGNDQASNIFLKDLGFVRQNDSGEFETNGKSPVLNVELTKDGQVLSSRTVEANESGKYTFNYEQTDENGNQNASINFNIKNVGEFAFGISNSKSNMSSSNESVGKILSHKGDLSPETYDIAVKNKTQVIATSNTNGVLTKDTLLSSLGVTSNEIKLGLFQTGDTTSTVNLTINGDETVGDLVDKINSSSIAVQASIKDGELVLKRTDGVDEDIAIGGNQMSDVTLLNNLGLFHNTNDNSQTRITAYSVETTDSKGNTISTNVFADENGKFFYTLEQEDGKSVTLELTSAGSTTLTISKTDEQISESMNNIINSINSEIEVTNNKAIKDFVRAYNNVAQQAGELLKLSSNTTSYSDKSAINSFMQKMNSIITQIGGKSGFEVGLSFQYNASTNMSSLNFDTEKFFNAIEQDSEGVSKYLSDVLNETVSSIDSFMKGTLANISSQNNSKINQYNDKISSLKSDKQKLASKLESDYKMIEQLLGYSSNQYSELFSALSYDLRS